jgi:hypothetical protein
MPDETTKVKEYDAKHGAYKSDQAEEVNSASSVIPSHEPPTPFKLTSGETKPE